MISTNFLQDIQRHGVALLGKTLPGEAIAPLRHQLRLAIDQDIAEWGDNPFYKDHWMVHNLMLRHECFMDVLDNKIMYEAVKQIFGGLYTIYAYTSSSMPAGGANYSHRIHVDCPRFIDNYITNLGMIIALDDFTEENGATYFLPGSHLSPTPPHSTDFFNRAIRLFPKAGEAIIFNARTWHLGGQNHSAQERHALTINFCRPFMKQRFDYPKMLSPQHRARLSEQQKQLLGIFSQVPMSLNDYYVPPDERLYRPGQEG
jgi:ectoine hydroxylase-related dioxygenase (phytanoyl-CoA dioxygenase family)